MSEARGVPDPVAEVNQPGSQSFEVLNEWRLDGVDNWVERVETLGDPNNPPPPGGGGQGGGALRRAQQFNPNEVNAYTTVDGSPLVYDESGNLTEDATRRYTYNYRNLLVRVEEKGIGGAPDTEVAIYGYDALGRRVWKRVPDPAGGLAEHTRYVYEGIKLIAELNARGGILREYVYAPVATQIPPVMALQIPPSDRLIAVI